MKVVRDDGLEIAWCRLKHQQETGAAPPACFIWRKDEMIMACEGEQHIFIRDPKVTAKE